MALPRVGSGKSWTLTRSGSPEGCHSRPPLAKLPTSSPGSPSALLRPGPLRTGRAGFPRIRLKQAQGLAGVAESWSLCRLGWRPWAAAGVHETKCAAGARLAALLVGDVPFGQRLPDGARPLLPFGWALRWVVGVEEQLPAEGANPALHLQQPQAEVVHRWGCRSTLPSGPVVGQGRVVG